MTMQPTIRFVGGGRMARAMAQGMLSSGVLGERSLYVADHNSESQAWWANNAPQAGCFASVEEMEAAHPSGKSDTIILAIKPHHIEHCVHSQQARQSNTWRESLIISVAAGISLEQLTTWLRTDRVARVMPNTPSLVGCGASAFCLAPQVSSADRESIATLLEAFGLAMEVPESQMDAVTGVSGSGPAYVFMFIEALADGGVMAGLPRAKAMQLAAQTVAGAAEMVLKTGEHPGALKDAVASPGGTTIAAIRTLEHNAFRGAVIDAVVASASKSRELG